MIHTEDDPHGLLRICGLMGAAALRVFLRLSPPRAWRILAAALAGLVLAATPLRAAAASSVVVPLRFLPKESLDHLAPKSPTIQAIPFRTLPVTDSRGGDPEFLGEYRGKGEPVPVTSTGSLAEIATEALSKCLAAWGAANPGSADLTLSGEILSLDVVEADRYSAKATFRFRLVRRDGSILWDGRAAGSGDNHGRSMKPDNYNETISDALVKAYSALVNDAGFLDALQGRQQPALAASNGSAAEPGPATSPAVDPATAKAELLKLKDGGLDEDFLREFAGSMVLSRPLSASEVLDWRAAGLTDLVVKAVVAGRRAGPAPSVAVFPPTQKDSRLPAASREAQPTSASTSSPVPDLGDGFLDLKWGAAPPGGMWKVRETDQLDAYRRSPSITSLGGVKVIEAEWTFWKERFCEVFIAVDAKGQDELIRALSETWGPADTAPPAQSLASWTRHFSPSGSTVAELWRVRDQVHLLIFEPESAEEMRRTLSVKSGR